MEKEIIHLTESYKSVKTVCGKDIKIFAERNELTCRKYIATCPECIEIINKKDISY